MARQMRLSERLFYEKLKRTIERIKERDGVSIPVLARRLDVSERLLYKAMYALTDMKLSTLFKLLDKLGLDLEIVERG